MKKIVEELGTDALENLLGERVTLFCCRYIYTGKLIAIDEKSALLTDCGIVYETGAFDNDKWSDYQKLPYNWHVSLQSVESFGILK